MKEIKVLDDGSMLVKATLEEVNKMEKCIWHDELPQHLIVRAKNLYPKVKDLFPNKTLDEWINGFKYEMYPETEITYWEEMVSKFQAQTKRKKLSAQQKKDIWHKILMQCIKEHPPMVIKGEIPFS